MGRQANRGQLTRNIGPIPPAINLIPQAHGAELLHHVSPLLLSLLGWVDLLQAFLSHPLNDAHDPVALHLQARGSIAKRRWCLRPLRKEKVGIIGGGHSKVRPCTSLPLFAQQLAIYATDGDVLQAAGDPVKAGRKCNRVELVECAIRHDDAVFGESLDGILLDT